MIDLEFIKRASEVLSENVKKQKIINYDNEWRNQNPDRRRKSNKKYSESEKGKIAIQKKSQKRQERMKIASLDLSWNDKQEIMRFYKNCPRGYQVDHIIPISKGGKHTLSNLQYLTPEENSVKAYRLKEEYEEFLKLKKEIYKN